MSAHVPSVRTTHESRRFLSNEEQRRGKGKKSQRLGLGLGAEDGP